jgi:hypothetical protein
MDAINRVTALNSYLHVLNSLYSTQLNAKNNDEAEKTLDAVREACRQMDKLLNVEVV